MNLTVVIDLYLRRMIGCLLHAHAATKLYVKAQVKEINLINELCGNGFSSISKNPRNLDTRNLDN